MVAVLFAWVGRTDLRAPNESDLVGLGPIAQALEARQWGHVQLLSDYKKDEVEPYLTWLRARSTAPVEVAYQRLTGPTEFGEIYEVASMAIHGFLAARPDDKIELAFHLSPGTPAMAAVWILLGKTRFPAELVETSRERGFRTAAVPFDISADFIPDLQREQDERLKRRSAAEPPHAPAFDDIIHRSRSMKRLIDRARRVAQRTVPVLIEGESGTGKEMLARAIHRASKRAKRPFKAVNCGAIPEELVESELFGHDKGAFTGAAQPREGYFKAANGGTLFLDEIGELPAQAQVKLLRVLQEGEVTPVGSEKPTKIDVRIIAATNRTLVEEIADGRFREDLFYRLAVAVLKVPPLRDREGDLSLLLGSLMKQVNEEAAREADLEEKKLSAAARNLLLSHPWPGNVRELLNTLRRVSIWSEGTTIKLEDVREALLPASSTRGSEILDRPLGNGFKLQKLLDEVTQSYLRRAFDEAHGNKTKAAKLVGLPNYQTFTNWMKKHGIGA